MPAIRSVAKTWPLAWALVGLSAIIPSVVWPGVKPDVGASSLTGTTWSGSDSDGDRLILKFEPGGKLLYKFPNGPFSEGTWKQSGNAVYFEMNNRFAEYHGVLDGNLMKGRGSNKHSKWTWQATKGE